MDSNQISSIPHDSSTVFFFQPLNKRTLPLIGESMRCGERERHSTIVHRIISRPLGSLALDTKTVRAVRSTVLPPRCVLFSTQLRAPSQHLPVRVAH